jgi:hypothetical protein
VLRDKRETTYEPSEGKGDCVDGSSMTAENNLGTEMEVVRRTENACRTYRRDEDAHTEKVFI